MIAVCHQGADIGHFHAIKAAHHGGLKGNDFGGGLVACRSQTGTFPGMNDWLRG
jgi:hypothetical protein